MSPPEGEAKEGEDPEQGKNQVLFRLVFRDEYIVQDIKITQKKQGSEKRRDEQCRGATIFEKNPVAEDAIDIPVASEHSAQDGRCSRHECQGRQENKP